MGIFKNLFGKPVAKRPEKEGDFFYVMMEGKFHLFKLLVIDVQYSTWHVCCYEPQDRLPEVSRLYFIPKRVWHAPIDSNGFDQPVWVAHQTVTDSDLQGYFEYLRQVQDVEKLAWYAMKYYNEAYYLTDQKKHWDAIRKYSLAIELVPQYFEAIDNRAFSKMDIGQWEEAILDFELSLKVKPDSTLALFSIGECLMRLKRYDEAILQFEKTLLVDPASEHAIRFMAEAKRLAWDG